MNEWTVMLYLSGDNDLSEESLRSMKSLIAGGLRDGVDIVACYDSRVAGVPTRLYDVRRIRSKLGLKGDVPVEELDGRLHEKATALKGEGMAYARTLRNFVRNVILEKPSRNFALILSGHGSGADGDVLIRDENPRRYLSVRRLRWAVEDALKETGTGKLGLLGFDACAMSTIEVAHELRKVADYLVAPEGFEPSTGWPYDRVLRPLNGRDEFSPERFGEAIVQHFVNHHLDLAEAGISVDLALVKLEAVEAVREAVYKLADELHSGLNPPGEPAERLALGSGAVENALLLAHWRAQSYRLEDYVDLWDLCRLLEWSLPGSRISSLCQEVRKGVESAVVKSCYTGPRFQHSHGLSIHFPWSGQITRRYRDMSFSSRVSNDSPRQLSPWLKFLLAYLENTRRLPRCEEDVPLEEQRRVGRSFAASVPAEPGRYTPDQDRYTPDQDRYTPDQDRYTPDQDRYTPDQDRYTPDQDRYTPDQDRYTPDQDRYTPDQDRYTPDQDKGLCGGSRVKNPPLGFFRCPCLPGS